MYIRGLVNVNQTNSNSETFKDFYIAALVSGLQHKNQGYNNVIISFKNYSAISHEFCSPGIYWSNFIVLKKSTFKNVNIIFFCF